MDNMGGLGGGSRENGDFFAVPEMPPTGDVPVDFGENLRNNEQMRSSMEQIPQFNEAPNPAEKFAEKQSSAMPTAAAPIDFAKKDDSVEESPRIAELEQIEVSRDAEALPKAYVEKVSQIINEDKNDPHKLMSDLDKARWDLMKKAFGRNRGDGLNGGKI